MRGRARARALGILGWACVAAGLALLPACEVPDRWRKTPGSELTPTPRPTARATPSPSPSPVATPTRAPTPEPPFLEAPTEVRAKVPFRVRLRNVPYAPGLHLWADRKWRLGAMGHDRTCDCAALTVALNTPGLRVLTVDLAGRSVFWPVNVTPEGPEKAVRARSE